MAIQPLASGSSLAAYTAASAMNALEQGMNATAHNIANVNTSGFDPLQVQYETGPQGQGMQVAAVESAAYPLSDRADVNANPAPEAADMASLLPPELLDSSNTELAREFSTMIATQRAYEANAVSVQTWDAMLGTLIDTKA